MTLELATELGFICRGARDEGMKARSTDVAHVDVGDAMHFYFANAAGGTLLGVFRIVAPFKHPSPHLFGKAAPGTALRTVLPGPLKDRLDALEAYEIDPAFGTYCGWPVVPDELRSPSYIPQLFPGRNALVRR